MNDDKKTVDVHILPSTGMREIHKQYGLWIIRGGASGQTPPDSFYRCGRRYFQFYSISHMYDGQGRLWLEPDIEQDIRAGDCVIITPRTVNRYGGCGGKSYYEDSLNFCGPVADMLMRSGVISNGVFPMGKVRRLLSIQKYSSDPAVDAQIRANFELQKLLTELYLDRVSSARNEYPLLDVLLEEIREHPEKWWSVREMSEMCNLSSDQMRRVFFQRTGVTPKLYVDRFKLNLAAEYLVGNTRSIAEAAERFGYTDQYHFSRRFKAVMGMSPKQYRISVGSISGTLRTVS